MKDRPNRALFPKAVKAKITTWAKESENEDGFTKGLIGVVAQHMGNYVDDRTRKLIVGFILGREGEEVSTKELSPGYLRAFQRWINAVMVDGIWAPSEYFVTEIKWLAKEVSSSKKKSTADIIKDNPMFQEALELGAVITRIEE